jgi:hypothetical protein
MYPDLKSYITEKDNVTWTASTETTIFILIILFETDRHTYI